jgi:hypothetical protein
MTENLEVYKENYGLKKQIKNMETSFNDIAIILIRIGGALNDNILRYTKEQRGELQGILSICREYEKSED